MTETWLCPDRLFDGQSLHADMAVLLQGGQVDAVAPQSAADPARMTRIKGLVTPGFVDLQVNGGGGVLLNTNPTPEGMRRIAAAHRGHGTVAIMPTVITDAPDVLTRAAEAAIAVHGEPFFAGLHIEGPHIAPDRRGTHDARFVRPMDDSTINLVADLRSRGIPVMITVAPEAATGGQIAALAATGAVVSLGHTNATADQARAAMQAGAGAVTHLFNAMSQMQNRAPGLVGAAINSDIYAGIICDGIHVADEMVGLAIRARPRPDRMFLVSDAMPTVGGPDAFSLYGQDIRLDDGRLINAEGSLAGAHVTQAQGVGRLVHKIGIPLETALRMAITVPATLIDTPDLAGIMGRDAADLIVLDDTLAYAGAVADLQFDAIDKHPA